MGSSLVLPRRIIDSQRGEFRLDHDTHSFYLGEKVIRGITGILKECGYINNDLLTDYARIRGTHVHSAIHYLNKGTLDWSSVADKYIGYVHAYKKFVTDWNLRLTSFETPLYHPILLFAGTPDLVGTVLDNVDAIIEIKTGPIHKWAALQTAAQELLVRAWETGKGKRRRRWGLTLNADGTYSKPKEFKEWDRDEAVFKTLNSTVQNRELYGA